LTEHQVGSTDVKVLFDVGERTQVCHTEALLGIINDVARSDNAGSSREVLRVVASATSIARNTPLVVETFAVYNPVEMDLFGRITLGHVLKHQLVKRQWLKVDGRATGRVVSEKEAEARVVGRGAESVVEEGVLARRPQKQIFQTKFQVVRVGHSRRIGPRPIGKIEHILAVHERSLPVGVLVPVGLSVRTLGALAFDKPNTLGSYHRRISSNDSWLSLCGQFIDPRRSRFVEFLRHKGVSHATAVNTHQAARVEFCCRARAEVFKAIDA
jgi:hypothetical protein